MMEGLDNHLTYSTKVRAGFLQAPPGIGGGDPGFEWLGDYLCSENGRYAGKN